jgi:hypothetical protein
MLAYIKSFSSFASALQREALDYKLTLDSTAAEKGSITINGDDIPRSLAGSWLLFDGKPYFIAQITPKTGKTEMAVLPVIGLFDRDLLYTETAETTIGGYIASLINSEWITQSDSVYATPYIAVTSEDTTDFEQPVLDDNGVFNLLDYINLARAKYNIAVRASIDKNTLRLNIRKETAKVHPLVLNDGHTQLANSSFSSSSVAKITVLQKIDSGEVDENDEPIYNISTTVWYLAADGTVSDTIPEERADGSWKTIVISEDEDPQEKATEEFSKNASAHKVELYSDVNMAVGDTVRVRLNGEIFEGQINSIMQKKSENRKLYRIGDLPTTLQEKINSLSSTAATVVYRSGGGGADLPIWAGGSY